MHMFVCVREFALAHKGIRLNLVLFIINDFFF